MQSIQNRKLAESAKALKEAERDAKRNHELSHRLDQHNSNKGGEVPTVVGGLKNQNTHSTEYQKKMLRGSKEAETRGTKTKNLTIFAKQQKAAGFPLFEME